MKIAINTRTSGKYKIIEIANRKHIVTTMMPIRGDIAMNKIFYPDKEVGESFEQLNMKPAPNGHPYINGENVPAFHPVANNAFNIGGFVANTRKKGKRVFGDFCLDVEVANKSKDGKKLIKRIKAGKKIGVSTGLTIDRVENAKGKDDFGHDYDFIGHGFNFDHVAILMNEASAGEHAGTELVLNEEKVGWCSDLTVNELSNNEIRATLDSLLSAPDVYIWIRDIYMESKKVIYSIEVRGSDMKFYQRGFSINENDEISLIDDVVEVVKKVEYKPTTTTIINKGDEEMDKDKIILAIIGNSANSFTDKDKAKLDAMNESALVNALTVNDKQAKVILGNAGFDFDAYEDFVANKEKFDGFKKSESEKLDKLRESITTNSDYTAEMLKDKGFEELVALNKMANPKYADQANAGQSTTVTTNAKKDDVSGVDFDQ